MISLFANLFASKPSASDAARTLSAKRWENERDHVKARARQIRDELGLPIPEALR